MVCLQNIVRKLFSISDKSVGLIVISLLALGLIPYQAFSQKKLEILHATSLRFDEGLGNGAKRLIGDVQFKHDEVLMFCDSAYFYNDNTLEAFSNIHIQQSDTIHLYGDYLKYNGNDKKAELHGNVSMKKKDMQLYTDALSYNVSSKVAYYTTLGRIINKENELISKQGYLYAATNDIYFKKEVTLTHQPPGVPKPKFTIDCDTMRFNTSSGITYFYGPTTIKSDENSIYCEDGWYNTKSLLSRFTKNSYLLTSGQKMKGDSLFYDGKNYIAKAINHVQIIDTARHTILEGNFAIHNETSNVSVMTDGALLIKIVDIGDTLFMHADTLKAIGSKAENMEVDSSGKKRTKLETKKEKEAAKQGDIVKEKEKSLKNKTIISNSKKSENKKTKPEEVKKSAGRFQEVVNKEAGKEDSLKIAKIENREEGKVVIDSVSNTERENKKFENQDYIVYAYHKVKFFKNDLQGKCDSLIYAVKDSVMKLYGSPVFWSDQNQLTADSAKVYMGEKTIKSITLESNGFIVSENDSVHYNQIRGKAMTGYFNDSALYLIRVMGNGQTIYYVQEEKELKAVNRAECSNLDVYLEGNTIRRIVFLNKPDATLFPIEQIDVNEFRLKGFHWKGKDRPKSKADVFLW